MEPAANFIDGVSDVEKASDIESDDQGGSGAGTQQRCAVVSDLSVFEDSLGMGSSEDEQTDAQGGAHTQGGANVQGGADGQGGVDVQTVSLLTGADTQTGADAQTDADADTGAEVQAGAEAHGGADNGDTPLFTKTLCGDNPPSAWVGRQPKPGEDSWQVHAVFSGDDSLQSTEHAAYLHAVDYASNTDDCSLVVALGMTLKADGCLVGQSEDRMVFPVSRKNLAGGCIGSANGTMQKGEVHTAPPKCVSSSISTEMKLKSSSRGSAIMKLQ